MQASEKRFLRKIKGVTKFDKIRKNTIRKFFSIESLILCSERSQLKWFDHVSTMPQERLPKQTVFAEVSKNRPVRRTQTRWVDYTKYRGWNRLILHSSKMQSVLVDQKLWLLNWSYCPHNP